MFQLWHISLGLLRHQSPNLFQQHQVSSGDYYIKIFRLKLIPIGLSCTLTSLLIVTPTISDSLQFLRAYSNKSDTISKKCVTGLETGGGGNNRTESWVPVALKRLYCLLISPSTVNLSHFNTANRNSENTKNSGDKILKSNMDWSPSPWLLTRSFHNAVRKNDALVRFAPRICSCFARVFSALWT